MSYSRSCIKPCLFVWSCVNKHLIPFYIFLQPFKCIYLVKLFRYFLSIINTRSKKHLKIRCLRYKVFLCENGIWQNMFDWFLVKLSRIIIFLKLFNSHIIQKSNRCGFQNIKSTNFISVIVYFTHFVIFSR